MRSTRTLRLQAALRLRYKIMSNGDETDVNPFVQLRVLKEQQASGAPVAAPPNPFMQREPNPFKRLRRGAPFSMEEEHPIATAVSRMFTSTVKDVSNFLVQTTNIRGGRISPAGRLEESPETQRYLASLTPEERESGQRGFAFVSSFAGGPLLESIPALGPALGKWGSLAVSEF